MRWRDHFERGTEAVSRRFSGDAGDKPGAGKWRRLVTWVFFRGNRRHIAIGELVVIYAVLLAAGQLWPLQMHDLVSEQRTVQQLLNTLLGGVILLVSIVVSLNSLVLSEELAPISDQHERVISAWEFRVDSTGTTEGSVSSASPTEFLLGILSNVDARTEQIALATERTDLASRDQLRSCLENVDTFVDRTREVLDEDELKGADMRLFAPEYDPVTELDEVRQLKHELQFHDEIAEPLETVIRGLEFFISAREYFKTMYYKREFARLSRDLLYAGVPAVILLSYLILALTGDVFPGVTFGLSNLYLFFTFAFVISLLPFFLLASYVIRASVIAEDTITATGFVFE